MAAPDPPDPRCHMRSSGRTPHPRGFVFSRMWMPRTTDLSSALALTVEALCGYCFKSS